jgi:hypothetical protein
MDPLIFTIFDYAGPWMVAAMFIAGGFLSFFKPFLAYLASKFLKRAMKKGDNKFGGENEAGVTTSCRFEP